MSRRARRTAHRGDAPRLRILHVTLGDPCLPGSDAMAVRTGEISRRLADRYDITVASPRSGGEPPSIDGVRHVRGGLPWGRRLRPATWRMTLPLTVLWRRPDVIVEECLGPRPVAVVPWPLRRPTVAVLRDQPAGRARRTRGVRPGRQLVATSENLRAELAELFPTAPVTVIPDGLPDEAFVSRQQPRRHVIYVGPLDRACGVDLLIAVWANLAPGSQAELTLVGDGADDDLFRERVARLGLASQVRFSGRVAPGARFDILAGARVVVVAGSQHRDAERAAEALAAASPVVAFDSPDMRDVVDATTGVLVPAGDTIAFGQAVLDLLRNPDRARSLGDAGPAAVAARRWDNVAPRQAAVYERAVAPATAVPATAVPATAVPAIAVPAAVPAVPAVDARAVAPIGVPAIAVPAAAAAVDAASTAGIPSPLAPSPPAPAGLAPGRRRVLRPRYALVALVAVVAVATFVGSDALRNRHPAKPTLADSSRRLTTRDTATTVSGAAGGRRTADRGRGGNPPPATRPTTTTTLSKKASTTSAPATSAPATSAPTTSTSAPTPPVTSSPATSRSTPPTTGSPPVTTPVVLTRSVNATLHCTGAATVDVTGRGGGANTLRFAGAGATKVSTGASAVVTMAVLAGTYTVTDVSTAGDPSMHWSWTPSTACSG